MAERGKQDQPNLESEELVEQPAVIETYVKIEARPAKDILKEYYLDDTWAADYVLEAAEEVLEVEPVETLDYEPLYIRTELAKLKQFSSEEQKLSVREQRMLVKHRLHNLKEALEKQKVGTAQLIRGAKVVIDTNPDISVEGLLANVKAHAAEYRLTENQLWSFENAFGQYVAKHNMVEKYRKQYTNDKELFKACFGVAPVGEIKVIKGPMTLDFQCLSREDYAVAYNQEKIKEDASAITDADKRKANLSSGAALYSVKIPELIGVVTIENLENHLKYEIVREDKTAEVKHSRLELSLEAQKKDIRINVKGFGSWEIQITERDGYGAPRRIQMINLSDGSVSYDVVRSSFDAAEKGYFKRAGSEDSPKLGNAVRELAVQKNGQHLHLGYVELTYYDLKILDDSPGGMIVTYQEDVALPPQINEQFSKQVQKHEEQHQFNKLFVPSEVGRFDNSIMLGAVERGKDAEEIKQIVIHDMLYASRQGLIDRRARDEMIAQYYDGGKTVEEVFQVMTQHTLYDYFGELKDYLRTDVARQIAKVIQGEMSAVTYQKVPESQGGGHYPVMAEELNINEAEIKNQLEMVFITEYHRDLRRWLSAITMLEQKGYNREEITSLLFQEPAKSWNAFARRLGNKD